jgi:Bacterial SH3 domain
MRQFKPFAAQWVITLAFAVFAVLTVTLASLEQATAQNQAGTPLPIVIPTRTATPIREVTPTPSRTPTNLAASQGRVEAKDKTVGANVRASPNTSSEKLGTIVAGQYYAIVQRWENWIQIQYDKSPSGLGWVYKDIVNITGIDFAAIPTVPPEGIPSPNVATGAAQQTAAYLTQTPGAPETATALQGSATGIFTRVSGDVTAGPTRSEPLPTFTFPPPMVEATLPPRASVAASQSGVPPVVPIIILGGIGLFGLLISALRRL